MSIQAPTFQTLAELLEWRVAETPDVTAFQYEDADGQWEPVSWRTFAERVASVRQGLLAAGLRKGDRLALIAPVSLQWELLHHAALSMGVVVVGMDAHDLPERIANMAEQADIAAFAASEPRTLSKLGAERLAAARFVLLLSPSDSPDLPGARCVSWDELVMKGAAERDVASSPSASDLATIIFTSGTTGAPKGIAYTHGQVCLAVNAIGDAFGFVGPGSRLLCWLPLSNLFQRIVNLAGVRNGPCTYLLADPRRVMDVVARVSPDIFVGVPRFYEKLYDGIQARVDAMPASQRRLVRWARGIGREISRRHRSDQPVPPLLALAHAAAETLVLRRVRAVMGQRLRCMVAGSAPMSLHLLEEFSAFGWQVLEAYGLSENVLPMSMNRIDACRPGTVGRPVPGNEIVIDADNGIRVRGPGVFAGYVGEPRPCALDSDGFYATGDLGRFDAAGYLQLVGRSSEMIKTSTGRRVMPSSAEQQLLGTSGLEQVLLIGNGRKYVVALGATDGARTPPVSRERIEQGLQEMVLRIGVHERPRGIAIVERLFSIEMGEVTSNLKLRRATLEARHTELIDRLYAEIDRQAAAGNAALVVLWG